MPSSNRRSRSTSTNILPSREQYDTPMYFHLSDNRPYFIPLPMNVTSIDPSLVLAEAFKYRDWVISPEIRGHFLEYNPIHTRTLLGNSEADEHAFIGFIYWVGVFTGSNVAPGVPHKDFWRKWLPDFIGWLDTIIKALESFIRCYPGEHMRRVPWEEASFEQGVGVVFHTLRLRARTFQTTIKRLTAPDTAWKSYHDRLMKPSGIGELIENCTFEDSDQDTDEIEGGTDMSEVDDRTNRTETETDGWITIDSQLTHPSGLGSSQNRDSGESGGGESTVRGRSIRGGLDNDGGVPEWNTGVTPASESTLSTPPAPRNRRFNHICSETSEENLMETAPNDNTTNDSTNIFMGNPSQPLTPSRLSSSDTIDEGEIMKDAIHEVLIDGTIVYVAITLGRPEPEATSSGNGVVEEEDTMDVETDNVSEAGTVMYESITVRYPTRQAIPSPPPSAVRARAGLRSIPRSDYRTLNQGSR